MFFFDDNTYVLRAGDPLGDQCAHERGLAAPAPAGSGADFQPVGTVAGVVVGCFPDLYAALARNMPDQVISL